MKVTDVKCFTVDCFRTNWVFVKVYTDEGIDGVGVVNQITNVISQELNVNMERILIEAHDGIFDGTIRLRVHDVDDIKVICDNLKKLNNIRTVIRVDE